MFIKVSIVVIELLGRLGIKFFIIWLRGGVVIISVEINIKFIKIIKIISVVLIILCLFVYNNVVFNSVISGV